MKNDNVRWVFVPLKRLAEYLGGCPADGRVRYVTGLPNTKTYKSNGLNECARRVDQIAAGSLRAENGVCHEA